MGKPWFASAARAKGRSAKHESSRTPWTIERTLHLSLAVVAIAGWALIYAALMRGIDPPQDAALSNGTEVSTNIGTRQTPSIAATPAALR